LAKGSGRWKSGDVKNPRSVLAMAGCLAVVFVPAACGGGSSGPPTTLGPNSVVVSGLAYKPADLSVKVGDSVTWSFQDGSVPHNVDGASDLNDFSSGTPQTSGTYTYKFKKAGSYSYHCDVHPFMKGTITVS